MKTIIAAAVAAFSINAHAFFGVSDEVAHCVDLRNNVGINVMELGERTKCYAEAQGTTSGVRGNFVWVRTGDQYTYIPMQEIREAGSREEVQQVITREVVNNVVVEELEADIEALEEEIESLNTQIDTLTPLAEMVPELQERIADLVADVTEKQSQIIELMTTEARLTGDVTRLQGMLDTANGEVTRLQGLLDTANADLASTRAALDTSRETVNRLFGEVTRLTSERDAALAIVGQLSAAETNIANYNNNGDVTVNTNAAGDVVSLTIESAVVTMPPVVITVGDNYNNGHVDGSATVQGSYTADTITGANYVSHGSYTDSGEVFGIVPPAPGNPPITSYYVGGVSVSQAAYNSVLTAVNGAIQDAVNAAYEAGYGAGFDDGYDAGYTDGYADGFADGVSSVR